MEPVLFLLNEEGEGTRCAVTVLRVTVGKGTSDFLDVVVNVERRLV